MSQIDSPLIERPTAGILIAGPEDLGKRVADLMAEREYSVQTAAADELVQELKVHDYDLVVLDLSGTRQEEDPLVDQVLEVQSWLSVVVMKDDSCEPSRFFNPDLDFFDYQRLVTGLAFDGTRLLVNAPREEDPDLVVQLDPDTEEILEEWPLAITFGPWK